MISIMNDDYPPPSISKDNSSFDKNNTINASEVLSSSTTKNKEDILAITSNDILCGRGSGPNDHCGNVAFRQIVSTRRNEYLATSTRTEKARIANEILSVVFNLTPPGRFLEKAECSCRNKKADDGKPKWNTVSEHKALEKVKQALRQMRHRKSDSNSLDYRSVSDANAVNISRCHHRRVQSAPGSTLSFDVPMMMQQFEDGNHRHSNSRPTPPSHHPLYHNDANFNGTEDMFCAIFDEPHPMMPGLHDTRSIYPSSRIHQSKNHAVHTTGMMQTRSTVSCSYNGAPAHHGHTPPPPPPSMHTPSPPRSDMYANHRPNHHDNNNDIVTSQSTYYHHQRKHELKHMKTRKQENTPIKPISFFTTTNTALASGVTSFEPEPARFIHPVTPSFDGSDSNDNDNQDHGSNATLHCVSTCSSAVLPLFESGGSSGLLPLAMDSLDANDDIVFDDMFDDKIPHESADKINPRSHYLSISREERSMRNFASCDDFSFDDGTTIVDPHSFKYTRSRDHHNPNYRTSNNFSSSSIDDYSIDEISANAGMTMMDMLESENSLPQQEDLLMFDFQQQERNPMDKFDRMVMAVTTPQEVWTK